MTSDHQHKIIHFLLDHPDLLRDWISSYYPLSESQLKTYHKTLNWDRISENSNIHWTYDILNSFSEDLEWETVTQNSSAFKDKSFLDKFYTKIDWYGSDDICFGSIVANHGLYWDNETIEKYADRINFNKLSAESNVAWSEALLDKYFPKWDLVELAHNKSIPWTLRLFDKYLDESYLSYYGVQTNRTLITFHFIEKYKHSVDWEIISANPHLPWIEKDLLHLWSDKIDWSGIASNSFLFAHDPDFYQTHCDKWQSIKNKVWRSFSINNTFPWTIDIIENHKHYIDWNSLCSNPGIDWNEEMIDNYKSHIDWNQLCSNEKIPWNEKLIDRYAEHIQWGGFRKCELYDERGNLLSLTGGECYDQGLIDNKSFPWSIDILTRYEPSIDSKSISNKSSIWEKAFKPYINDEMIKILLG
jgi:hypothetical protein